MLPGDVSPMLTFPGDSIGDIAAHSHGEGRVPMPCDEDAMFSLSDSILLRQFDRRVQVLVNDMRTFSRNAINTSVLGISNHVRHSCSPCSPGSKTYRFLSWIPTPK
ncbi:hypothetical protein ARTHRO9AX_160019 [Arthrobacter sp. 9AX]|nr:hypothetical protein ARTHRO9AX_160019 [Arthrobacter sp. 9AX]